MTKKASTVSKLRTKLEELTEQLAQLIQGVPIKYNQKVAGDFVFIMPDFGWDEPSLEERNLQIEVKRKYDQWSELLELILANAPKDIARKLERADESVRKWLELDTNWSITQNRQHNEQKLREDIAELEELLDIIGAGTQQQTIAIPDTNSLLNAPDPTTYRKATDESEFVFLLLPTVLSELDDLKTLHRVPEVRDKAKKMITRVKGWRNQGSLVEGVTVDQSITVRATAQEPKMEASLSWLDENVSDDRIIASVLELVARQPTARIVLVTGDINLLNKADVALIECVETPSS